MQILIIALTIIGIIITLFGIGCVAKIFGTTFENADDAFKYALGSILLLPLGFALLAIAGTPYTSLWRFPIAIIAGLIIGAMMFTFSETWHLLRPSARKTIHSTTTPQEHTSHD